MAKAAMQTELAIRLTTLFRHWNPDNQADESKAADGGQRISAVNQFDGGRVPKFYLLRSASGCLWRARADINHHQVQALAEAVADEPTNLDDASGLATGPATGPATGSATAPWRSQQPTQTQRYHSILARGGARMTVYSGPVFCFASMQSDNRLDGIEEIGDHNRHKLRSHLADWLPDVGYRQPMLIASVANQAVAVCASVRISNRIHEAGIATAPAYRGQGYAVTVTAAWAKRVRALGATPYYSTQWSNDASRRVAAKLELSWVANEYHLT